MDVTPALAELHARFNGANPLLSLIFNSSIGAYSSAICGRRPSRSLSPTAEGRRVLQSKRLKSV
jgi:hypothetical protein